MEPTQSQTSSQSESPLWLAEATSLKQETLARLSAMPKSERDTISPPASWSASGIVEHLILSEEYAGGIWQERLKATPDARVTFKSAMLSRVVSFMFSKTGARVPGIDELEPAGGLGIEELERRWDVARQRLVDTLPRDPHAAWVLHPVLGPLNSLQTGRILSAHLAHHLRHWPKPIK